MVIDNGAKKKKYKERNGTVLEVYLLLTSVLSVTLWRILSFNSTSRRQVYSPPWLTPTLFRKTGPSKIVEFSGSSETFALLINTPFLIKETFTSFASPWLPLSVMLQINLTLLPCSTMPTWEIATSGILLSKKQTIQTEFYLLARILPSLHCLVRLTRWNVSSNEFPFHSIFLPEFLVERFAFQIFIFGVFLQTFQGSYSKLVVMGFDISVMQCTFLYLCFYISNSLHLARKCMLGCFSADIICSEKWKLHVSFEEQILSKDKYPGIFSRQMDAIGFFIVQIFFATCAVSKIGQYLAIIHRRGGEQIYRAAKHYFHRHWGE